MKQYINVRLTKKLKLMVFGGISWVYDSTTIFFIFMMRLLHFSKAKSLFFLTQRLLTYHNNRKCQHSGIFQGRGHHFCWTMGGTKNSNDLRGFFPFLWCLCGWGLSRVDRTIKILLHFYAPVSPTKDDFILSIIWKKATVSRIQKCSECVSKNVSAILIQPSDIFYVSGGSQLWHLRLFCLQIFASFWTQSFESFLRILQKNIPDHLLFFILVEAFSDIENFYCNSESLYYLALNAFSIFPAFPELINPIPRYRKCLIRLLWGHGHYYSFDGKDEKIGIDLEGLIEGKLNFPAFWCCSKIYPSTKKHMVQVGATFLSIILKTVKTIEKSFWLI